MQVDRRDVICDVVRRLENTGSLSIFVIQQPRTDAGIDDGQVRSKLTHRPTEDGGTPKRYPLHLSLELEMRPHIRRVGGVLNECLQHITRTFEKQLQ